MTTAPVQSSGYPYTQQTGVTKPSELGRDQFLMLLLAQLRNQDPLKPMEDREFITQLAQFNVLEQMQQVNENLLAMMYFDQLSQASSLIGKTIEATDPTTGTPISGVVTAVALDNGLAELVVGDTKVPLENIKSVK